MIAIGPDWIGVVTVGTYIISSTLIAILSGRYITRYFEYKISHIRERLSEKILNSNYQKAEDNNEKIVPVLLNDIVTIGAFAKNVPDLLVSIFKIFGVLAYMIILSWEHTVAFTIIFSIVIVLIVFTQPIILHEEKQLVDARNLLHRRLTGLAQGIKELFLNSEHKVSFASRTIAPVSSKQAKHASNLSVVHLSIGKAVEAFILVSFGMIVWISSTYSTFDNDLFLRFITLVLFVLPALSKVSAFVQNLKKADIALDQIESLDLMFSEFEDEEMNGILSKESTSDGSLISLQNISYVYSSDTKDEFKVGPFSLQIYENEVLFITGGNGSGKTTLVKLLLGLYDSRSGAIYYHKEEITPKNLAKYRDLFSVAFSASYVFQDLGYIPHERVNELAQKYFKELEIADKVSLRNGIELSNTDLSFGQMGRLGLFRALLEDKSIYVFDEWAANQDPHFKKKFYREIIPSLKAQGKTIILVSHDDKYFDTADRIVRLRNGQVEKTTSLVDG